MFMKVQQLNSQTGVLSVTASCTNEAACGGAWSAEYEIAKMTDEPTMFMKAQQLSKQSGILAELQITQNKQLTMAWVERSAE